MGTSSSHPIPLFPGQTPRLKFAPSCGYDLPHYKPYYPPSNYTKRPSRYQQHRHPPSESEESYESWDDRPPRPGPLRGGAGPEDGGGGGNYTYPSYPNPPPGPGLNGMPPPPPPPPQPMPMPMPMPQAYYPQVPPQQPPSNPQSCPCCGTSYRHATPPNVRDDDGIRVTGMVGDDNVNLQVGGKEKPKCKCCCHEHGRARSRERGRKTRRKKKNRSPDSSLAGGESSDDSGRRGNKGRSKNQFQKMRRRVDDLEEELRDLGGSRSAPGVMYPTAGPAMPSMMAPQMGPSQMRRMRKQMAGMRGLSGMGGMNMGGPAMSPMGDMGMGGISGARGMSGGGGLEDIDENGFEGGNYGGGLGGFPSNPRNRRPRQSTAAYGGMMDRMGDMGGANMNDPYAYDPTAPRARKGKGPRMGGPMMDYPRAAAGMYSGMDAQAHMGYPGTGGQHGGYQDGDMNMMTGAGLAGMDPMDSANYASTKPPKTPSMNGNGSNPPSWPVPGQPSRHPLPQQAPPTPLFGHQRGRLPSFSRGGRTSGMPPGHARRNMHQARFSQVPQPGPLASPGQAPPGATQPGTSPACDTNPRPANVESVIDESHGVPPAGENPEANGPPLGPNPNGGPS
ncbi:hypothetical protein BT63DRAFT_449361 [Microthyrium microscopicum]|uniref:Uncharacterized protein n=1 Tax=Microthyrium microscopicum TaxID=703497 RepID=A0A6A6USH8_9PEZI|nr:hypothetical protein BT63DRAFT_449361 [Microthyrium microscopicum]